MVMTVAVWADGVSVNLPENLKRVTMLSELKEGDCYALLKNLNKENYLLLCKLYDFKDKGCLAAEKRSETTEILASALTVKNEMELWLLCRGRNGGMMLKSVETGRFLGRGTENNESLTFYDDSSELCEWLLKDRGNGSFDLAVPESNRVVEYGYRGGKDVFGIYSKSAQKGLWLYRLPMHYADMGGDATVPADGSRVVMCNGDWVYSTDGGALKAENYRLTNGKMAEMPGSAELICEVEGKNDFALRDGKGRYLNYALQMGGVRCMWRVVNGQVRTAETNGRFLCFDEQTKRWRVTNEEEATTTALFAEVAPKAAMVIDDKGICRLSGGWGANELAGIDLNQVNALDLTEALLPLKARSFERMPTAGNLPVFVRETDGNMAKGIWPFVIGCGDTNRLLTRYELKDKGGFVTDRNFSAETGMLTYRRKRTDGASWQTVCLPFDVANPNVQVAELTDLNNGVLTFRTVKELKAGVAYIVYASADLYWQNRACTVTSTVEPGRMQGCFTPWVAKEGDLPVYLLLPGENAFAVAPAGSSLPPFRAWLQAEAVNGKGPKRQLLHFKIPK